MIDLGKINEAENILLDSIDYTNNNEVIEVALFYQYLSEKDNKFLENNNYTKEEVLSGFKHFESVLVNLYCINVNVINMVKRID